VQALGSLGIPHPGLQAATTPTAKLVGGLESRWAFLRAYAEVRMNPAGAPAASSPHGAVSGRARILTERSFQGLVSAVGILLIGVGIATQGDQFVANQELLLGALFWIVVIGLVELLPVPGWRSLQVSMDFPLATAVAFIYPPYVAGLIIFLGSSDPREFRREVDILRALFNRSQVAISTFATSLTFHALGGGIENWADVFPAAVPAVLVDFIVNTTLVGFVASLGFGLPFRVVIRKMRIGSPAEFLVSYIGLGFVGVLLARLYYLLGWWAVAGFVLPLLLARQMFFRTRALEDATKELQDREVVLRALSDHMAEERQDERQQIAGYLHDDLAQVIYRMSLHIDISERQLDTGNPDAARGEIEAIRKAKERAQELIRALIRDLHRSPLGRAGLVQALFSFCSEVERDSHIRIRAELSEVDLPAPVQLLCYQVAREAVMNAVTHSGAEKITVSLREADDGAHLSIADDGAGFDVEQGSPEGHFGLTMMRERAQVAGGSFRIESAPGEGTTVIAEFPTSLLGAPAGSVSEGATQTDRA
jgi:signal transduction histidine kinase